MEKTKLTNIIDNLVRRSSEQTAAKQMNQEDCSATDSNLKLEVSNSKTSTGSKSSRKPSKTEMKRLQVASTLVENSTQEHTCPDLSPSQIKQEIIEEDYVDFFSSQYSPSSDNGSDNIHHSMAEQIANILCTKQKTAKGSNKTVTPFQYLCRHVDRLLFYTIFGNAIDGYLCPLCCHFCHILPRFLIHMRIHRDVRFCIERYLKVGGKMLPQNETDRNLFAAVGSEILSEKMASKVPANVYKKQARQAKTQLSPKRIVPVRTRKAGLITRCQSNNNNKVTAVDVDALNSSSQETVPESPSRKSSSDDGVTSTDGEQPSTTTATTAIRLEDLTLGSPELPNLDISDDGSVKCYSKAFADYIESLQPKLRLFRKNGITLFEILCKFLDRKSLHDSFEKKLNHYICMYCQHALTQVQYMMLHLRGHQDLTLLLETYLRKGGTLQFDESKLILPRTAYYDYVPLPLSNSDSNGVGETGASTFGLRPNRKRLSWKMSAKRRDEPVDSTKLRKQRRLSALKDQQSTTEEVPKVINCDSSDVSADLPEASVDEVEDRNDDSVTMVTPPVSDTNVTENEIVAASVVEKTIVPDEVPSTSKQLDESTVNRSFPKVNQLFTRVLQPQIFYLLHMLIKEGISKETPHYCMFCGQVFYSDNGIFVHYNLHNRERNTVRRSFKTVPNSSAGRPGQVQSAFAFSLRVSTDVESANKDVATSNDSVGGGGEGSTVSLDKKPEDQTLVTRTKRAYRKRCSTRVPTKKILCLLGKILSHKVTRDKPHFCKFCGHPFFTKKGIYDHYILHDKSTRCVKQNEVNDVVPQVPNSFSTMLAPTKVSKPLGRPRSKNLVARVRQQQQQEDINNGRKLRPTRILTQQTLNMLRKSLKDKISKTNPHICRICSRPFYCGSGLYGHYLWHEKMKRRLMKPKQEVADETSQTSSGSNFPGLLQDTKDGDGFITADALVPQTDFHVNKRLFNNKSDMVQAKTASRKHRGTFKNLVSKKQTHSMPLPKKLLDAKTLRMLQGTVKKKITPLNPHFCKHCDRRFNSGCGMYMHYYLHWKEKCMSKAKKFKRRVTDRASMKQILLEQSSASAAAASADNDTDQQQSCSQAGMSQWQTSSKVHRSVSKEQNKKTAATPEKCHFCTVCHRMFTSRRGMYKHYILHMKLNPSLRIPASEFSSGIVPIVVGTSKADVSGSFDRTLPKKQNVATTSVSVTTADVVSTVVQQSPRRGHVSPKKKQAVPTRVSPSTKKEKGDNKSMIRRLFVNRKGPGVLQQSSTTPPPDISDMLKQVILEKITPENPHYCKFCEKPFVNSSGLYLHYWRHNKDFVGKSRTPESLPCSVRYEVPTEDETNESKQLLSDLESNATKLLYCLTKDAYALKELGWPQRDVSEVLMDILTICKLDPVVVSDSAMTSSEKLRCLRQNIFKLMKFCIKDDVMAMHGWENKPVDDVVKELVSKGNDLSIFCEEQHF